MTFSSSVSGSRHPNDPGLTAIFRSTVSSVNNSNRIILAVQMSTVTINVSNNKRLHSINIPPFFTIPLPKSRLLRGHSFFPPNCANLFPSPFQLLLCFLFIGCISWVWQFPYNEDRLPLTEHGIFVEKHSDRYLLIFFCYIAFRVLFAVVASYCWSCRYLNKTDPTDLGRGMHFGICQTILSRSRS